MPAILSEVATAKHTSLAHINCKQQSDESLTALTHRQEELLVQSCNTTAEQCNDKT